MLWFCFLFLLTTGPSSLLFPLLFSVSPPKKEKSLTSLALDIRGSCWTLSVCFAHFFAVVVQWNLDRCDDVVAVEMSLSEIYRYATLHYHSILVLANTNIVELRFYLTCTTELDTLFCLLFCSTIKSRYNDSTVLLDCRVTVSVCFVSFCLL